MISMQALLDMIETEAIEFGGMSEEEARAMPLSIEPRPKPKDILLPIRYNLELLKDKKGRLYWTE